MNDLDDLLDEFGRAVVVLASAAVVVILLLVCSLYVGGWI